MRPCSKPWWPLPLMSCAQPRSPSCPQLRPLVDLKALARETARLRRGAGLGPEDSASCMLRYLDDEVAGGLLQWVRAVCAPYGLAVANFTWSFADGRALCYLVRGCPLLAQPGYLCMHGGPRALMQDWLGPRRPPQSGGTTRKQRPGRLWRMADHGKHVQSTCATWRIGCPALQLRTCRSL
jgi:hypothetical protein